MARDFVGAYPDGVWLVELAALSEEELAPKSVAEALEALEHRGRALGALLAELRHLAA